MVFVMVAKRRQNAMEMEFHMEEKVIVVNGIYGQNKWVVFFGRKCWFHVY